MAPVPQIKPHNALSPSAEQWLIWLSDPLPVADPPHAQLTVAELSALLRAAEKHGTLPSCVAALKHRGVAGRIVDGVEVQVRALAEERAARAVQLMAVQMNLWHHGQKAERALNERGLPYLRVKGKTYADRLYPSPTLRGFTDIDLLIPVSRREDVGDAMRSIGLTYHAMDYRKGEDYFEDKWTVTHGGQEILIEVHANLVHNPRLRAAASLQYEDVLEAGDGDGTDATALLLVAATHGSASHQFDRLQHVVDVLQCARGAAGPVATSRLGKVARRCGLTLPVLAALDLAGRTFNEPRCAELIRELSPGRFDSAAARLLSGRVVIAAQSEQRSALSWRRKAFRQALRISGQRARRRPV